MTFPWQAVCNLIGVGVAHGLPKYEMDMITQH